MNPHIGWESPKEGVGHIYMIVNLQEIDVFKYSIDLERRILYLWALERYENDRSRTYNNGDF